MRILGMVPQVRSDASDVCEMAEVVVTCNGGHTLCSESVTVHIEDGYFYSRLG